MTSTTPSQSRSNEAPTAHPTNSPTLAMHSPSHTSPSSTISCLKPDGRRNSLGEPLHSPLETWTPNLLTRNQSWNHQDLKRAHVEEGLKREQWRNDEGVVALGYSYEGAGGARGEEKK